MDKLWEKMSGKNITRARLGRCQWLSKAELTQWVTNLAKSKLKLKGPEVKKKELSPWSQEEQELVESQKSSSEFDNRA